MISIEGKGYLQAKYLQRGDKLVTVNGEQKIVEFIEHVIYEQPIAVYNFEVEGNHNYFVGKESRVLAHNVCEKGYNITHKKANQLGQRNWDMNKIDQAYKGGKKGTSINRANGNKCSVYTLGGDKMKYVVIDDITNTVVQISNMNNPAWNIDKLIQWL